MRNAGLRVRLTRGSLPRMDQNATASGPRRIDNRAYIGPTYRFASPNRVVPIEEDLTSELARIHERLRGLSAPSAMLDGLFALAPFAVQVFQADGRCLLANRAYGRLFGAEPSPEYNVFTDPAASQLGLPALVARALEGERVRLPATWREPLPETGSPRLAIEATFFPLFDESGAATHVAVTYRDCTAEVTANEIAAREAALRRASERTREWLVQLQHVTSLLSEAVTPSQVAQVILEQGLRALGARRGLLGLLTDDGERVLLLGSRGFDVERSSELEQMDVHARQPMTDAIRRGHPVWIKDEHEYRAQYPALADTAIREAATCVGAIPLSTQGAPFGAITFEFEPDHCWEDEEQAFFLHLARQCAQALERARLYGQAQDAARRAEEATRAKDEFLSIVSHELRTPLNAILGWCHMMITMRDHNPNIVERGLQVIQRNAKAQVTIIEDILEMSRIVTGKFRLNVQHVDLRAVVLAAIESVRPSAGAKGLRIDTELAGDLYTSGDPDRLQQIAWNLLSNAIKFTPEGGLIRIVLERRGERAVLVISDTGQGIGEHDLPFVFDRFRQADSSPTRSKGGLGLGLAIVRHLVEAHGGKVFASSQGIGHGATFDVELPVLTARERPDRLTPSSPPGLAGELQLAGLGVLVVDDEADSAEMVGLLLGQHGARVETACSAAEGLQKLEAFRPDVLVSDIGMPAMDGLTFLRRVRESSGPTRAVPAIALTAYASSGDAHTAKAAGFMQHIPKPVDPGRLIVAVAEAAGR